MRKLESDWVPNGPRGKRKRIPHWLFAKHPIQFHAVAHSQDNIEKITFFHLDVRHAKILKAYFLIQFTTKNLYLLLDLIYFFIRVVEGRHINL